MFFNFLKTTPGYLLCIFLPFALLILSQAVQTVRLFRAYRREQAGAGDSDAFALPEPQSGAEIAAQAAPFTPAGRAAAWTCTAAAIWAAPDPVPSVRRRGRWFCTAAYTP